jgi:hypothetical protein
MWRQCLVCEREVNPLRNARPDFIKIAMTNASVTSCAVMPALIDHPTTRREKRSMTAAT